MSFIDEPMRILVEKIKTDGIIEIDNEVVNNQTVKAWMVQTMLETLVELDVVTPQEFRMFRAKDESWKGLNS